MCHPSIYCGDAGFNMCEGRVGEGSGTDVDLSIICIAVKVQVK